MSDPNFIILYVDNPIASTTFYADLLGKAPLEVAPTFAMFALSSGVMLGLWSRHTVSPATTMTGGGTELAFSVTDKSTVLSQHEAWVQRKLAIVQAPIDLDFGYTFVALDPDGHRLRVFAPHKN